MSKTDEIPTSPGGRGDATDVRRRYDWSETAPSTAVVETVAAAIDRDPVETGPLYDVLDPDALNELFAPVGDRPVSPDLDVSFRFEGLTVTVRATGTVSVRAPEEPLLDATQP